MKSKQQEYRTEKCLRYSIRKVSFGAASVAVAALFMFLGNGAVSADELGKQDVTVIEKILRPKLLKMEKRLSSLMLQQQK